MHRRSFLTAALLSPALAACRPPVRLSRLGIPFSVLRPGMAAGHALRDGRAWPAPSREVVTEVAILGSGIAGLSAAWRLGKDGFRDFVLLAGPEPDGNAAAETFPNARMAPRGAHYLPVPTLESTHVRDILADLGLLQGDPHAVRPVYDETALLHAPEERVFSGGRWHEGLLPKAATGSAAARQQDRLSAHLDALRETRGSDGRRAFTQPLELASRDEAWRALDRISFAVWLAREGYDAPALLAYLDYACRDDYGAGIATVSAYAGLHYFASRNGQAANATDGALLTWPEGLQFLARGLRRRLKPAQQIAGHALRVENDHQGVKVLCFAPDGSSFVLRARRAICAMPLHLARHVVADLAGYDYDPARDQPHNAPWLVGNFLLEGFPREAPGAELAWDNVVAGSPALGWVVSTHQLIRTARPAQTVFTTYRALAQGDPAATRRWLQSASDDALIELALEDLRSAYSPVDLWRHLKEIRLTLRGHAMATPTPGFLTSPGRIALREADGPLLFAHSDLSGLSVFEEASWWGERAARRILKV